MNPDPEPGWKLLAKSVLGIAITFIFSIVVLGAFVHLIDAGGSWWFTGHHLVQEQWYEAVRNTVATVALSVAGGAAYLAYRRQRTADLTQGTANQSKEIAAKAQLTAAEAQMLGAKQYALAVGRRADDQVKELRDRFSTAAEHLAHASPAVRIAGVYALTALAEDWAALERTKEVQVCIDVLCGYLRLPYTPEHGDDHHSKRVVKRAMTKSDSTGESEAVHQPTTYEEHFEYRQNDRQVRQTIVRVISAHLRLSPDAATSWSNYDFDFQGAQLEDADFSWARFSGGLAKFEGATFSGRSTSFYRARFSATFTSFNGATFTGFSADFHEAAFSGESTTFSRATFSDEHTNFSGVTFSPVTFWNATFSSEDTNFFNATFSGEHTNFGNATFSSKKTSFGNARFSGEHTNFGKATFSGEHTTFVGATFGHDTVISFDEPKEWNNVSFDWDHGDGTTPMPSSIRPRDWPPTVVP